MWTGRARSGDLCAGLRLSTEEEIHGCSITRNRNTNWLSLAGTAVGIHAPTDRPVRCHRSVWTAGAAAAPAAAGRRASSPADRIRAAAADSTASSYRPAAASAHSAVDSIRRAADVTELAVATEPAIPERGLSDGVRTPLGMARVVAGHPAPVLRRPGWLRRTERVRDVAVWRTGPRTNRSAGPLCDALAPHR